MSNQRERLKERESSGLNLPASKGRQPAADFQPADDLTATAPEPSLVALAMSGDDEAFEELVRRRQGSVRGLMHRLSGDRHVADDYAQEAFLRAWQKLRTLRSPDAFGGWLRRIAVNVFLQHVRRAGQDVPDSDETETLPAIERRDHSIRIDLQNASVPSQAGRAALRGIGLRSANESQRNRFGHGAAHGDRQVPYFPGIGTAEAIPERLRG